MADPGRERDDELRALFEDAVSDVDPSPALHDIQNRTKVTPMSSKRPWIYAALGAVAATAATLVAVTVLSDDDRRPVSGPAASPTPSLSTSQPPADPTEPSEEPSEDEPSTGPAKSVALPVYFVSDTNTGPRLFREFHKQDTTSVAKSALVDAVTESAQDPDYYSPWAGLGTTVGLVTKTGGTIVVDLAGDLRDRPSSMSEEQAGIAVQQLIYTAQAALQDRSPVQFLLDGDTTETLLGVPAGEPLAEGDPMQVQGTVWVISPQDGDEVGTSFSVEGRGAFFEANVSWQLLRDGEAVEEGFATAEEGMTLSPYAFEVEGVEPGDYVLRVYDADMSGGEGNGEAEDTKRVTVTE